MSKIGDKARTARSKAGEALGSSKQRASAAYGASRQRASKVYSDTQARVKRVSSKAGQQLDDSPLAFLIGGLALGALVGSLLPRSQQERKALAPAGKRINKAATTAARAAKTAGQKKLDSLGISKDAAKKQARTILKSVGAAASEASSAAAKSVRKSAAKPAPRRASSTRATPNRPA
jgi:hypothetical protein